MDRCQEIHEWHIETLEKMKSELRKLGRSNKYVKSV